MTTQQGKATFNDWLNRERLWPVEYNRFFTRTVFFWESHLPKAETMLTIMVDVLHWFDSMAEAKMAIQDVVHWAHTEGYDTKDEVTIALMAKRFFKASNLDRRPLNEDMEVQEVKL